MKKILFVVFIALIIGGGLAFMNFKSNIKENNDEVLVKAFQVGVFTNYDNASRVAERNNGIVISDNDVFRVFVAILNDKDAIEKLQKYYGEIGLNYYLKDLYVSKDFSLEIKNNEELLKVSTTDTYSTINLAVLKIYKDYL